MTDLKYFGRNDKRSMIRNLRENDDIGHIRNIHIKYILIIIVQYTITENVPFVDKSHKNDNNINNNHSPYQS